MYADDSAIYMAASSTNDSVNALQRELQLVVELVVNTVHTESCQMLSSSPHFVMFQMHVSSLNLHTIFHNVKAKTFFGVLLLIY